MGREFGSYLFMRYAFKRNQVPGSVNICLYSRLNNFPQRYQEPINVTLLKRVFATVIKILRWEYPVLFRWAPNSITCIFVKKRQRKITHTEKVAMWRWRQRLEREATSQGIAGSYQKLEEAYMNHSHYIYQHPLEFKSAGGKLGTIESVQTGVIKGTRKYSRSLRNIWLLGDLPITKGLTNILRRS